MFSSIFHAKSPLKAKPEQSSYRQITPFLIVLILLIFVISIAVYFALSIRIQDLALQSSSLPVKSNPDPITPNDLLEVVSIPTIRVETNNNAELNLEKGFWNENVAISILKENSSNEEVIDISAKIKTRGSSTYNIGLKYGPIPYKIKFSEATSMLGFEADRNFLLLPNFIDPSYVRQFFFFSAAQLIMGGEYYQPVAKYVELEINGKYQGLYLLVESIEETPARLDLAQFYSEDESSAPFIVELEMQKQDPEIYAQPTHNDSSFSIDQQTRVRDRGCFSFQDYAYLGFELSYPSSFSEISDEQGEFIREQIGTLYRQISAKAPLDEVKIDLVSFAKYFLFQELFYNSGYGTSSVYYYSDGDTIYAGPLWDFDRLTTNYTTEGFLSDEIYYQNELYLGLLEYQEFRDLIRHEFNQFKTYIAPQLQASLLALKNNDILKTAVAKSEQLYHRWTSPEIKSEEFATNRNIEVLDSLDAHIDYINGFIFSGLSAKEFWNGNQTINLPGRLDWLEQNIDQWL